MYHTTWGPAPNPVGMTAHVAHAFRFAPPHLGAPLVPSAHQNSCFLLALIGRKALIDLLGLLGIIAVDGSDCLEALELPIDDFEDALIVTCASKAGIGVIITGDIDFLGVSTPMARVVSVADFLRENGLRWGRG